MAGVQANIRTFITPLTGPGRLAPTLLEDLTLYDPAQPGRPNVLRENPFDFIDGHTLGNQIPPGGCRHDFWLKPRQSKLPELDEQPSEETRWRVAAMCGRCRVHLTLDVDYTIMWQPGPCPNDAHHLHHLIRSEWRDSVERRKWEDDNPGRPVEICGFECSSQTCSAFAMVRFTPPEIDHETITTLVDTEKLRERTEAAFRTNEGNTQGMKQPLPIDVLNDLRIYVKNAWDKEPSHRSIKLSNRRFIVRFGPNGEACKEALESLGFELDMTKECWHVPTPDLDEPLPLRNPDNVILDNYEHELLALMLSRPAQEQEPHQHSFMLTSATREFERALSCQDYDKHPASRRMIQGLAPAAESRTRAYNTLGVPQSASDDLVVEAYRNQIRTTDPKSHPYYLEFLGAIARERNSEIIQTEHAIEKSRGRFDMGDLAKAFKSIGLEWEKNQSYDDDYIIGMFNSRLMDMRLHEHDLRQDLRIIGEARGSSKIRDVAENTMITYEQALVFLGADETVSDDQITALFGAKVGDNKTLETQAMDAVRLIAEHRNSVLLHNWINAGFAGDLQMGPVEGFQALQIDNRTVDDELIVTQYDFIVGENPVNAEYYTKALDAIARDRDSSFLRGHLQRTAPQPTQGTAEEPVGLDNIGNTCYLNSLLQFLFTMVELRQVVLNFDQFKMELNESTMLLKKVGQRKVTNREVQTAQKFIENLALLFRGMIETPQSAIRPEKELARLTLETHSAKERVRRRSTLMSDRPSLGHIDSQPIHGPLPMPDSQVNGVTDDAPLQSPKELEPATVDLADIFNVDQDNPPALDGVDQDTSGNEDNSSEATLVSRPGSVGTPILDSQTIEGQHAILDNKENLSPTKEQTAPVFSDDHNAEPLAPASPSKVNAHAGALAHQEKTTDEPKQAIVYAPPPGKPPPVPPRNPVEPTTDILEEYARQQDVTEVIAHCLFQFSCAMRPTGVDKSGEQLDEVHDMFFGQNISHVTGGKEAPTSVQFFSIITRVANEPNDVYAALDTEYDLSVRDNGTSAFLSIAKLPPVFSIALDRVVWDAQAKRPTKLNHHVQVPETIFLDRYLESADGSDLMERRLQTWHLKRELFALQERRKALETKQANTNDLPQLYDETKFVLEHLQNFPDDSGIGEPLEVSPKLINTVGLIAEDLKSELESIKPRINDLEQQVKEAFADMRKHPYRLHAAFFHRGSAGGGHYWVYIYDHKKEVWRSYNDDRVSVVANLNEIFGKPQQENRYGYATPANPYFLVYVKEELVAKLVQSVKREIVYPPPSAPPPQFTGFGMSIPSSGVRNQMSELPPGSGNNDKSGGGNWEEGTGGEVEMIEYAGVNGTHQSTPPVPASASGGGVVPQHPNAIPKVGNWDDSELMITPRGGW